MVRALKADGSRHAILRFRANAVRSSIALDTLPKVGSLCFPGVPMVEHRQDGFFSLPNKSQIWLGGLDDKERVEKILGNEYATIYLNECSQIPYQSVLVALTRLAQTIPGLTQRAYYDLNPTGKGHWTNQLFGEHRHPLSQKPVDRPENYARMFLNPADNVANLTEDFLAELKDLPERQRRRFYEGMYVDEIDGALWTYEVIEQARHPEGVARPPLTRIVVGVDPSGASEETAGESNKIGIVVAGLGADGHGYVIEDATIAGGPAKWGRAVVDAYHRHDADSIIAETNFGGEMVRFVIKTADENVPVRLVTASRGKHVRAEPVSALYEQKRVHHLARMPMLEEQMCSFSTMGYQGEGSPDRADALVWALTELMAKQTTTGIIEFYRQQAVAKDIVEAELAKERSPSGYSDGRVPPGSVAMKVPPGISTVYTGTGACLYPDAEGVVMVPAAEVAAMGRAGFERVNADGA